MPASGLELEETYSFRDPAGRVCISNNRVFRIIYPAGRSIWEAFQASDTAAKLRAEGRLVGTTVLDSVPREFAEPDPEAIVLQHERIAFPSFPYEWPPQMLHAAATLTLDIAEGLLDEGLGLKDGTPYNVLFRGPKPVFVDVLSFEEREPGDPTWLPYAQFVRTFLLPLLAAKHFHHGLDQIFLTRRDGLEAEEVLGWLSFSQKLRPPFLSLVSIPSWLGSRTERDEQHIYRKRTLDNPEKARFILNSMFRRMRGLLNRLEPRPWKSTWQDYMSSHSYNAAEFNEKDDFVRQALADVQPARVLDIGCNTGHFSIVSARAGASVVGIDYDPVVIGNLWSKAWADNLDILPLVVNLARPTPAMGWRNRENASFLERSRGQFNMLLMLAVVHHLLVTERVPLSEIFRLAAELSSDALVVEYVGPEDPMFRVLTRGREELHRDLTVAGFENAARKHFHIVASRPLKGDDRRIYLLRKST